jgi:glucosamine kinase
VVDLAATGEKIATEMLELAGAQVSAVARALVGDRVELPLALTGGLAEAIAPRLDADLRSRLTPPVHDGALGAALMARHTLKMSSEA